MQLVAGSVQSRPEVIDGPACPHACPSPLHWLVAGVVSSSYQDDWVSVRFVVTPWLCTTEPWAPVPEGRHFRIVSEPLPGKGRLRYMGCGPEGRVGLAMQERHRSEATGRFFHLLRGDVVRIAGTEERGDGLALGEGSTVEVVAPAGRPFPPRE